MMQLAVLGGNIVHTLGAGDVKVPRVSEAAVTRCPNLPA